LGTLLSNLENLQELEFGEYFNQQIFEDTLPQSLIKLTFGYEFNNNRQPLGNAFSNLEKLQELHFGKWFNQAIFSDTLPNSLIKLGIQYAYTRSHKLNLNRKINIILLNPY
jgi:hypothetical protein